MRWTYCSGTFGSSKLKTWLTPATSMPRAAMSVATRIWISPVRNAPSARSRCGCDLLPWIASALDAGALQVPDDAVGAVLGAGEDERAVDLGVHGLQHRASSSACFSAWLTKMTRLLDALGGRRLRRHRDLHRIVQELRRRARRSPCGIVAEKNRLWRFLRQHADDALQRMDEAEVEHLVGLVEDEDLDVAEVERALVDQVEQAAGRGDEDVDAARQAADLAADRHAAEHRHDAKVAGSWP